MKRLVSGNEAIFQGAIQAGASYFAGYPISPTSEILQQAALYAEENPGFRFLQAEDEIAAAIATISAALAGAKAFTATSGPGFTLMQEALGWGHVIEAPCVFVNSMRVGPSTGMPTQPAQSDLLQVKAGSAGDYYPIAFYPNSVEECFRLTAKAFNAAEESLSPVILDHTCPPDRHSLALIPNDSLNALANAADDENPHAKATSVTVLLRLDTSNEAAFSTLSQ